MPLLTAILVAAGVGVAQQGPAPSKLAEAAVAGVSSQPPAPEPHIAFEIHDVTATSPDWRGKMLPKLQPVAREEGVAVWALDADGVRELIATCQDNPQARVLQAPRMIARLGDPVRMSNEEESHYVAHLKRISDGPPNEGTHIAFQPEVDKVHDGIRVELSETRLKGSVLFAKMAIQHNKVLGFHTTNYKESIVDTTADPEVVKTSLLSKLRSEGDGKVSIAGTIQVPEISTRRIEGDWMIPSQGGLLVSMGPQAIGAKAGVRKHYEERLIVVTAHLEAAGTTPPAAPTPQQTP
jgi:hypothetical protein